MKFWRSEILLKINKIRVAAYCRVSTDKEDQLASLQTQKQFFEEYAKLHNFELVEVYADEGISGTKLKNRKSFNKMMLDATFNKFDKVFVKDISRFARNAVDFLESIRKLKSIGIKCEFINANLSTEDGEFTLGILALVAQEESANMSKRVKFGKAKNAEKGKVPNLIYGYNKTIGNLFNLEINQFEASIIKRIYSMYVFDGYGANKIAQILNKENIKTKRNCNWSQNAISRILQNPIYIGQVINGKEEIKDFLTGIRIKKSSDDWIVTENKALQIIDAEIFNSAKKILELRKKSFKLTSERQSCKYSFSTLIKCGCCGYSFRRVKRNFKTKQYIKWTCSGKNSNGKDFCGNKTYIDENNLMNEIKSFLIDLLSSKNELFLAVKSSIKKELLQMFSNNDIKLIENEIEKLKKIRQKQTEMFEVDAITIDELKERICKVNTKIDFFEKKLKILNSGTSDDILKELMQKYCKSADAMISENILDNQFLKQIINFISVNQNGKTEIHLNFSNC